jgi:diaminohydroxyphosphoribosylaminopyrimidine deaminase/5-amino-6-(5-phosphoribosylamino)uracil reductase
MRDAGLDGDRLLPQMQAMCEGSGTNVLAASLRSAADIVELRQAGVHIVPSPLAEDGRIDLDFVLRELGQRRCNDVLVEAGPTLTGRILQLGLADEIVVYLAPMLLGPDAQAMANLPALQTLTQARRYTMHAVERMGEDVKLVLRPVVS